MTTALLVVGILVFLIVVHELGHFFASKLFRVKVEEFGIGYPPRAFLLGKWGDTEYTLNWLPFGGFVRLFGEHGESGARGSFAAAPKYAQAVILIAGVTMNAFAAWFLFAGALAVGIPRVVPEDEASGRVQLFVNSVVPSSPADAAGIKAGDEITRVADKETGETAALKPSDIVAFIGARGGQEIDVTYRRNEEVFQATLRPAHAVVEEAAGRPAVGLGLVMVTDEALSWWQALKESVPRTLTAFRETLRGLGTLARDALAGNPNLENIVGPVGLVDFVGNATKHGWGHVLALAGFISVNLAIINLVPVPALDGGRLALLGIEAVIRREPPRRIVQAANLAGIALIVFLMVSVTYNDIVRLLT